MSSPLIFLKHLSLKFLISILSRWCFAVMASLLFVKASDNALTALAVESGEILTVRDGRVVGGRPINDDLSYLNVLLSKMKMNELKGLLTNLNLNVSARNATTNRRVSMKKDDYVNAIVQEWETIHRQATATVVREVVASTEPSSSAMSSRVFAGQGYKLADDGSTNEESESEGKTRLFLMEQIMNCLNQGVQLVSLVQILQEEGLTIVDDSSSSPIVVDALVFLKSCSTQKLQSIQSKFNDVTNMDKDAMKSDDDDKKSVVSDFDFECDYDFNSVVLSDEYLKDASDFDATDDETESGNMLKCLVVKEPHGKVICSFVDVCATTTVERIKDMIEDKVEQHILRKQSDLPKKCLKASDFKLQCNGADMVLEESVSDYMDTVGQKLLQVHLVLLVKGGGKMVKKDRDFIKSGVIAQKKKDLIEMAKALALDKLTLPKSSVDDANRILTDIFGKSEVSPLATFKRRC